MLNKLFSKSSTPKKNPIDNPPRHIGIIMDGNRRYAEKRNIPKSLGHESGAKRVKSLMSWCSELGIKELTLYTFSMQNFNRPKDEVETLMNLFKVYFDKFTTEDSLKELKENGIRINIIGRIHLFPKDVRERINKIINLTKNNNKYQINFAMGYGGQEEILDAIKNIAELVEKRKLLSKDITIDTIKENLYISQEPDIIIRTGGERRSSNFLPFQSVYSEWFYTDKMWPEFSKNDLLKIIKEYSSRKRRFGK